MAERLDKLVSGQVLTKSYFKEQTKEIGELKKEKNQQITRLEKEITRVEEAKKKEVALVLSEKKEQFANMLLTPPAAARAEVLPLRWLVALPS